MNAGCAIILGPLDKPGKSNIDEGGLGCSAVRRNRTYCFLRARLSHRFSISFLIRRMNAFISESTAEQSFVSWYVRPLITPRPILQGLKVDLIHLEVRLLEGLSDLLVQVTLYGTTVGGWMIVEGLMPLGIPLGDKGNQVVIGTHGEPLQITSTGALRVPRVRPRVRLSWPRIPPGPRTRRRRRWHRDIGGLAV